MNTPKKPNPSESRVQKEDNTFIMVGIAAVMIVIIFASTWY